MCQRCPWPEQGLFGRDAADGDEVAKGELRAATYSELALGTSLTRNEPDRVDYPGKAPRGERAQPVTDVKVYYCRMMVINDANKKYCRVAALHSRPRPFSQDQEAAVHHAVPGVGKWERRDRKAFSNAPRRTVLAPLVHEPDVGGWISLGARCKRRQASCGLGRSTLQVIDSHSS